MIRLVFIGGTYRALMTFEKLIHDKNVTVLYAIFMKGYENEHIYSEKLKDLALTKKVKHKCSEKIDDKIIETVKGLNADLIYGGGVWRSRIPEGFFKAARYGYISLHGTALPEYRGMAGINWQIMNGADQIRMRFFRMAHGIDDGDLVANGGGEILEYSVDINNEMHLREILDKYDNQHLKATDDLIKLIKADNISFIKQDEERATYGCHFGPDDAEIDWSKSTKDVFNLIRSQSRPYTGSYTYFKGRKITIWKAKPLYDYLNYQGRINGKVVERNLDDDYAVILTSDGAIKIVEAEAGDNISVIKLFSSIRDKCQTKIESAADFIV